MNSIEVELKKRPDAEIIQRQMELLMYWMSRCYAAEKCIEVSPCDPDITAEQIEAHKTWENIKAEKP